MEEETKKLTPKQINDQFKDCALIEIIHLHAALRGAILALAKDVQSLCNDLSLHSRVSGRFQVIWSVFKSHSNAEDEFIWPALRRKEDFIGKEQRKNTDTSDGADFQADYEEDHADEERMFEEMDSMLQKIRQTLARQQIAQATEDAARLLQHTHHLSEHLLKHLSKEETQCMPLVLEYLSKEEINELVGNIMGRRSALMITNIMTMAVQNLNQEDREEMVQHMKESMAGTFFDKWLLMSGWMPHQQMSDEKSIVASMESDDSPATQSDAEMVASTQQQQRHQPSRADVTSQAELEKLIRAVAANSSLTPEQKTTTIQGLRDSVWKSNKRQRAEAPIIVNSNTGQHPLFPIIPRTASSDTAAGNSNSRTRRVTPPMLYYKKTRGNTAQLVWNSDDGKPINHNVVPLFTVAELAPTYHDGAAGNVLGCPHYSRACKLRHPQSGRLYTCRLCCDQQRELPIAREETDEPLDRYQVSEVMCMRCSAVQPAEDRCINSDCESRGKPFAKYFCRICHLYDDGDRPIFHCPYCNTCRLGKGLGIDFRHCMRCNACVSLEDDSHHCIPQKLQGDCPICNESLFQSTDPLRGLKCGHVMHMQCFTEYRKNSYTCPLCMSSMEDMKDYFALLDAAIRMQPMPQAYLHTMSNIYCQDCGKTGQVQYHFVGQKCPHCSSYNTREMGRVEVDPTRQNNSSSTT